MYSKRKTNFKEHTCLRYDTKIHIFSLGLKHDFLQRNSEVLFKDNCCIGYICACSTDLSYTIISIMYMYSTYSTYLLVPRHTRTYECTQSFLMLVRIKIYMLFCSRLFLYIFQMKLVVRANPAAIGLLLRNASPKLINIRKMQLVNLMILVISCPKRVKSAAIYLVCLEYVENLGNNLSLCVCSPSIYIL